MKAVILFGIFTLALLLLDLFCVYRIADYFKLKKNGVCCFAEIIKLERERHRTHSVFRPWIEYITSDGVTITSRFEDTVSFKSKKYSVGNKVKIYYDKENTSKCIVENNSLYIRIFYASIVTIFLVCIGIYFIKLIVEAVTFL